MSATSVKVKRSTISASGTGQKFDMTTLLAVVFLLMAVLQAISFSGFKDWLSTIGYSGTAAWAAVIIVVEVVAALGLLRLALPAMAKMVAWTCAILASGFWFVENLRLVSDAMTPQLTGSGFFGKYLSQPPSWWTILEVTILLFWTLYALDATKD